MQWIDATINSKAIIPIVCIVLAVILVSAISGIIYIAMEKIVDVVHNKEQ